MKTLFPIILVGMVLVGGYLLINKKDDSVVKSDQEVNVVNNETPVQEEGKKMAFTQFVNTDKGSYECTVKQYVGETESIGTTFVSNGKVRGTFNTSVNGTNVDTNIIVKDGFSYVWTSMTGSMGFKSPIVEGEGDTQAGTVGTYSWNGNQIGDYDCTPWALDNSKFELPSDINFTAMAQ